MVLNMSYIKYLFAATFISSMALAIPSPSPANKLLFKKSLEKAMIYVREPREINDIGSLWLKSMLAPEAVKVEDVPKKDPLARLFSDDFALPGLVIQRQVKSENEVDDLFSKNNKEFNNYFYKFDDKLKPFFVHAYDDILIKSLYCKETGHDDLDAYIIKKMRDFEGGYTDTHAILAIWFLEAKNCISTERFQNFKAEIIEALVKALDKNPGFSDLYAEQVAFLFWAGRGDLVKEEYIETIVKAQKANGSWEAFPGLEDMHTVGLSTVALREFLAGSQFTPLFPNKELGVNF